MTSRDSLGGRSRASSTSSLRKSKVLDNVHSSPLFTKKSTNSLQKNSRERLKKDSEDDTKMKELIAEVLKLREQLAKKSSRDAETSTDYVQTHQETMTKVEAVDIGITCDILVPVAAASNSEIHTKESEGLKTTISVPLLKVNKIKSESSIKDMPSPTPSFKGKWKDLKHSLSKVVRRRSKSFKTDEVNTSSSSIQSASKEKDPSTPKVKWKLSRRRSKTVIKYDATVEFHRFIPEQLVNVPCQVCKKVMNGKELKCQSCGYFTHLKCSHEAPPCTTKTLSSLKEACGEDFVPPFIIQCIEFIDGRLNAEGLYRKSSSKALVDELLSSRVFDQLDVHTVASALKQYLRNFNDSICPNEYFTELLSVEPTLQNVKSILHKFPKENYTTLKCILLHLHKVVLQKEVNRMDASNLGVVFGPTLLKPGESQLTLEMQFCKNKAKLVEFMISHVEQLYE